MKHPFFLFTVLATSSSLTLLTADIPPSCPGGQCAAPGGDCATGQCAAPGGSCASGQCAAPNNGCGIMTKICELIYIDDDSGESAPQVAIKLANGIRLLSTWDVTWFHKGQAVRVEDYTCCHLTLITYDCHGNPQREFKFHKYSDSNVYLFP